MTHGIALSTSFQSSLVYPTRRYVGVCPSAENHFILTEGYQPRFEKVVLTKLHIIVVCANRSFVKEQLVQVYMLPDNGERTLRLSHEAIIRCRDSVSWSLLRASVIDPITGSSRLRLLRVYRYRSKWQFECVDLTLLANSTQDILPMSVNTHVVFTVSNIRCDWGDKFLHASANGLLRGLCIVGPAPEGVQIRKFTIDATGERCMGPLVVRLHSGPMLMSLTGMCGIS